MKTEHDCGVLFCTGEKHQELNDLSLCEYLKEEYKTMTTFVPKPGGYMEQRVLLKNARIALISCIAEPGRFLAGSEEFAEVNRMIEWIEALLEVK